MAEQIGAKGYVALSKETVKGTISATPSIYAPWYNQSVMTNLNLISDEPSFGYKYARYSMLQGIRDHGGSIQVMGEPVTLAHWHNMLMTKGSTSGAGPYTHPFAISNTTDPVSYTMDISYGSYVERFLGVEAGKITYSFDGEKLAPKIDVRGLASFTGAEVASIATNTVTLKTDKDPEPTRGLNAGDLVRVIKSNGTFTDYTISSYSATTVTLSATAATYAAGDMLVLRPASVSFSILSPIVWGNTHFFFAADASTAFTNSSTLSNQTRLDPGSEISIMHNFNDDAGEKRSGAYDPASLIRTVYDAEFKAKLFLDNPNNIKEWNSMAKKACVVRMYTGSTNQYEVRLTLNKLIAAGNDHAGDAKGVYYHDFTYSPNYDSSDGQPFDVKILNNAATV